MLERNKFTLCILCIALRVSLVEGLCMDNYGLCEGSTRQLSERKGYLALFEGDTECSSVELV